MGESGQRHTPDALPPGKRPGSQCIGSWAGPRSGLGGCGKSRSYCDSTPDRPFPIESLYRVSYRSPLYVCTVYLTTNSLAPMNVYVYVCICLCTYYMCVCVCVCVLQICVCMYYVSVCVCMYVYVCISVCLFVHVCMYVCMFMCIYVCICICVCMYVHMYVCDCNYVSMYIYTRCSEGTLASSTERSFTASML